MNELPRTQYGHTILGRAITLERHNILVLASAVQRAHGDVELVLDTSRPLAEFLETCARNGIKLSAVVEKPNE